jgi:5-methylcytosine-specific restriction endonuclease McrA
MRVIKLSPVDEEMKTREDVISFFTKKLRQKSRLGRFGLTKNKSTLSGITKGTLLIFSYETHCMFLARSTGNIIRRLDNPDYPAHFIIDIDSIQPIDVPLRIYENTLREKGLLDRKLVDVRHWPEVPDELEKFTIDFFLGAKYPTHQSHLKLSPQDIFNYQVTTWRLLTGKDKVIKGERSWLGHSKKAALIDYKLLSGAPVEEFREPPFRNNKGTDSHIHYLKKVFQLPIRTGANVKVWKFDKEALREILFSKAIDSEISSDSEDRKVVEKSLKDSPDKRRDRLKLANKIPKLKWILVPQFQRNPDVIAETLFNAKGLCGDCNRAAPFHRASDGTPFLEVHHKIQLSKGGEDSVENTIALCPNCHRKAHLG